MNAIGRIERPAPDPALIELVKALARAAARRDAKQQIFSGAASPPDRA